LTLVSVSNIFVDALSSGSIARVYSANFSVITVLLGGLADKVGRDRINNAFSINLAVGDASLLAFLAVGGVVVDDLAVSSDTFCGLAFVGEFVVVNDFCAIDIFGADSSTFWKFLDVDVLALS